MNIFNVPIIWSGVIYVCTGHIDLQQIHNLVYMISQESWG